MRGAGCGGAGRSRHDARSCSLGARKGLSADTSVEAKLPVFALYVENFQKVYSISLSYRENQVPEGLKCEVAGVDREQEFQRTFHFSRLSCSSEKGAQVTAGTCVHREQVMERLEWVRGVASRFGLCVRRVRSGVGGPVCRQGTPVSPGGPVSVAVPPPARACVPGGPRGGPAAAPVGGSTAWKSRQRNEEKAREERNE